MPMSSRVATYVAAGRFSSRARAPLRISQTPNSSARRRRWRAVSGDSDGVVGMGQRAGDVALVHVRGAQLDVGALACSQSWSAGAMP